MREEHIISTKCAIDEKDTDSGYIQKAHRFKNRLECDLISLRPYKKEAGHHDDGMGQEKMEIAQMREAVVKFRSQERKSCASDSDEINDFKNTSVFCDQQDNAQKQTHAAQFKRQGIGGVPRSIPKQPDMVGGFKQHSGPCKQKSEPQIPFPLEECMPHRIHTGKQQKQKTKSCKMSWRK